VLELDHRVIVTGDIAGAAGASAHAGCGLDHGADHLRVLAHAEIVVGTPDHDRRLPVRRMPDSVREAAGDALEIGEQVTPLAMEPPERIGKNDNSCGFRVRLGRARTWSGTE